MKRYNTPHRSRVVKTRMTEEEYAEFAQRLSAYHMSQAEFIRQAITGAAIRPVITISPVNDELLAAVGKLTAEYGRIGGNLNQIARTLNEWHSPYPQLAGEVRAAVSDLAALKFEVCLLYTSGAALVYYVVARLVLEQEKLVALQQKNYALAMQSLQLSLIHI